VYFVRRLHSARMNHYEKGRHTPDYSILKRIAKILRVPVAYFYAESDELAEWIKVFDCIRKSERIKIIKQHDIIKQ